MSAFLKTEMNFIPDFYLSNKSKFLKNCIKNPYYIYGLFNAGLQIACNEGLCDKLFFTIDDFSCYDISFSKNKKILFISLPYPKNNSQFGYLSFYCLPYIKTKFITKPLGLYAIQHLFETSQENIVSFYKNSKHEICHTIVPCNTNVFETFCNLIFK